MFFVVAFGFVFCFVFRFAFFYFFFISHKPLYSVKYASQIFFRV